MIQHLNKLLGVYPIEGKRVSKNKNGKRLFIVTLFMLAKILKIIPIIINKKVRKFWYIYTIECYSTDKHNNIMNLKNICVVKEARTSYEIQ